MVSAKNCRQCGSSLPALQSAGLCPVCLLAIADGASQSSEATSRATAEHANDAASAEATTPRQLRSGANPSGFAPPAIAALNQKIPNLEFLRLLGQGGMGAVYLARQISLDRLVAVKIIRPDAAFFPEFARRFTREAKALARLNHANIVGVFDYGEVELPVTDSPQNQPPTVNPLGHRLCYLVMEYVDGINLRTAMTQERITPMEALVIVPQICQALQFAHDQGIIHRDIKPENILLDKTGRVKIADFGLAKLVDSESFDPSLTDSQHLMGTLRYMAPEQMRQSSTIDHRADIYSLGVVFYELLTGELPVGAFEPPSDRVQIDVRLDQVVLRALAKSPEKRYQQASEIRVDVENITKTPRELATAATRGNSAQESIHFASCKIPRDSRDFVLGLVGSLLVLLTWYLIPMTLLIALLKLVIWSWPWVMCLIVGASVFTILFVLLFVVMAVQSVDRISVDRMGIQVQRFFSGDEKIPWSRVENIQPLEFWEVMFEFLWWPGLRPNGPVLTQSVCGFFRIRTTDRNYYYCPQDVDQWTSTIETYGPKNLSLKPGATARVAPKLISAPVGALAFMAVLTGLMVNAFIFRSNRDDTDRPSIPGPQQAAKSSVEGPVPAWEITSHGVGLTESFATKALRLDEMQRERANEILAGVQQRFLTWESQQVIHEVTDDGRTVITIPAQAAEVAVFRVELWSHLDSILSVDQQRVARLNLKFEPAEARSGIAVKELVAPGFFGWSEHGGRIEIWREGTWYHWRISTRGYELEQQSPDLPLELQRFMAAGKVDHP